MKSMRPSPLQEYISRATRILVTAVMSSLVPWGRQHRASVSPGDPGRVWHTWDFHPVKSQLRGSNRSYLYKSFSPGDLPTPSGGRK